MNFDYGFSSYNSDDYNPFSNDDSNNSSISEEDFKASELISANTPNHFDDDNENKNTSSLLLKKRKIEDYSKVENTINKKKRKTLIDLSELNMNSVQLEYEDALACQEDNLILDTPLDNANNPIREVSTKVQEVSTEEMINLNKILIEFYKNQTKNIYGFTLEQMWNFTLKELEKRHNYIQWMFPLDKPSRFEEMAPVLDENTINIMLNDKLIIENLKKSFAVIINLYGLTYDKENKSILRASDFQEKAKVWLTENNHNFARISRILKSLTIFKCHDEAQMFFNILTEIKRENPTILDCSYLFWKESLEQTENNVNSVHSENSN